MLEILKLIGFPFKIILITLIIIFCFAGLYGIVHTSYTNHKNNHHSITKDALEWGLKMTRIVSFVLFLMIAPGLFFPQQSLSFLDVYAEAVDLGVRCAITTMVIGFIGALVTLFND